MAVPDLFAKQGTTSSTKAGRVPNLFPEKATPAPAQPTFVPLEGLVPSTGEKTYKPSKPFFEDTLNNIRPNSIPTDQVPGQKAAYNIGASFLGGLAQIPKGAVNIKDLALNQPLDQNRFVDKLAATGQKYQEAFDVATGQQDDESFVKKLEGGVGSAGTFLIPSAGVGKVAEVLSGISKYGPKLAKVASLGTMTGLESSQEAGAVYDDVLAKSGDQNKATDVAQSTFAANVVLGAITNKYSQYFENLPPGAANILKRVLAGFAFEGGQEAGQQMISNLATDKPLMEGVKDSALIGGIIGSAGTIATANVFNEDGTVNKEEVIKHLNDNQVVPLEFNEPQQVQPTESTPVVDNPAPEQVQQDTWENSDEGKISQIMHEEITPLVQQFNETTDPTIKKDLQVQIEDINSRLAEVEQQYISKNTKPEKHIVSENVAETAKKENLGYDPNTQVKLDSGEIIKREKPILNKSGLKELLKTTKQDSITLKIGEGIKDSKTLEYVSEDGKQKFTVYAKALGLDEKGLNVGEDIQLSADDLKSKGIARDTSLRVLGRDNQVLASKGPVKLDDFEQLQRDNNTKSEDDLKIYEKTAGLIKKYATRVAEGNLRRGTAGTFDTKTNEIRLKGMNSFSVAVHEITHQLDLFNNVTGGLMNVTGVSIKGSPIYARDTAPYRQALSEIYLENYVGAKSDHKLDTRMSEGYAMLLERYAEMPKDTTEKYGFAVKEFLQPGGKFYKPVVGDILADIKDIVTKYQGLNPLDKIGARVTQDNNITGKQSFLNLEEKVRTEVADAVYPIEKISTIAGVTGKENPSLIIRHYSNVNSYFANNVEGKNGYWGFKNGEFKKVHDFNWGTLVKGLEKSGERKDFDYYLVARRAHFDYQALRELKDKVDTLETAKEEIVQDVKDGFYESTYEGDPVKDVTEKLNEANKEYETLKATLTNDQLSERVASAAYLENRDKFKGEEKMFDTLIAEDLKLLNSADVQLLNDEEYKKLSSREGYASYKREFYNEIVGDEGPKGSGGKNGKASVLKQRHGSSRTIISPLLSGVKSHAEILQKSMKQVVYNKMVKLVDTGNVDNLMSKVPLKTSVDADGVVTFPQEKDPTIIMGRIDGKRVPVQTDAFIKNTLDTVLDYSSVGSFEKLFQGVNRLFTKGTTSSFPPFALTNLILDQFTAWSNTRHSFKPFISPLKTLYKAVIKKNTIDHQYWQEYLTLVGDRLAIGKAHEMSANELAEYLAHERKGILRAVDMLNKGMDVIAKPAQFSESITRASEYIEARKKGADQVEAMDKAAQLTAHFARLGKLGGTGKLGTKDGLGKSWVKSIPYFNAGIQVTDQMYRQFKTKEGMKNMMIVTAAITAANVASMALLMADASDDQKELYKDLSGSDLAKYIYIPNSDGKTLTKIRMPDFFMMPSAAVNMLIAEKYFKTKYTVDDFVDSLTSWIPTPLNVFKPKEAALGWIPQIAKPWVKVITNIEDFPRVRPLQGQGQLRKPAEERYTPSTPAVTKILGRWTGKNIGLSPIQLDALIVGYFGRVSGYVTGKPGIRNLSSTFTQKAYFEGGRRMQMYYDVKDKVAQDYSFNKISEKYKNDQSLTEEEKKTYKVYKLIHGYTPNDIPGVKEDRVRGIEDELKDYKDATDQNDTEKANKLIKVITDKINALPAYK